MSLRSPLGRVLGLGSAKGGVEHWWAQRVTAIGVAALGLWFVISLLSLPGLDYVTARRWLAAPFNGFLTLLFVSVAAYHSYLGATVVIEDYVRSHGTRVAALLLVRFIYVLAAGAAVFAVLRICFGT